MKTEDYPPQDPFPDFAIDFEREVSRRSEGIEGEDVSYGPDPYQGIALHVPPEPNGSVYAFIHGGGWTCGYKEHMAFMAPGFNDAGVIFASIGYRLAPRHLWPAGLEDVASAFAWIFDHISEYGGDPEQLFLGGHSAGGHYSSLLAVRRDWQAPLGLPLDVVRGCLPISGVYRFGEGSGLSMRPRFLGDGPNELAASSVLNIQGTPPPFLMAHGSADFPHLMVQAEEMEKALLENDAEVERLVLPGRDHFSANFAGGEVEGPWLPQALAWIASHTEGGAS